MWCAGHLNEDVRYITSRAQLKKIKMDPGARTKQRSVTSSTMHRKVYKKSDESLTEEVEKLRKERHSLQVMLNESRRRRETLTAVNKELRDKVSSLNKSNRKLRGDLLKTVSKLRKAENK